MLLGFKYVDTISFILRNNRSDIFLKLILCRSTRDDGIVNTASGEIWFRELG